jgi:hypothetical protein
LVHSFLFGKQNTKYLDVIHDNLIRLKFPTEQVLSAI